MSTLLKKLTISFLIFLVVFTSLAPNFLIAKADSSPDATPAPMGTWYNSNFGDWFNKVYNENVSPGTEIFGERYTAAQVQWVIYGVWAFILNVAIPQHITSCLLTNTIDLTACGQELQDLLSGSKTTGSLTPTTQPKNQSLLSEVFADRPLSGISYVKNKIQNFSLVPLAHAQAVGFGYNALKPIQDMWIVIRNIAFGLFVLAAVIFAFMIMFRVKISPQVVITVQSAIPKLVLALILVTFSYAIAGFLIDLMYVVIGFISLSLAPLIPTVPAFGLQPNQYNAAQVFELLTAGKAQGFLNAVGGILNLLFIYLTPLLIATFIICLLAAIAFSETIIGTIIAFGIFIIIVLTALWISFKAIFALFKAFANIMLLTIFAPLQIAVGPLVPNFGFGQWVKSYISNLSVFVVTGVLWLFAWIFGLLAWQGLGGSGSSLIPPVSTGDSWWPPLLGFSGTTLLFTGVSLVLFTMIPKATELVQSVISGKPFAYGSGIGEALGPVKGIWGQTGGVLVQGVQRERGEAFAQKYVPKITEKISNILPKKQKAPENPL